MTRAKEITKEAKKFAKEIDDWEIAEDVQDAFEQGALWADAYPHWISVEDKLPPRSELNENISDAVITFGYYDNGLHYLVELNRYHYKDGRWLWSDAKYWMPFRHPEKGGEE